MADSTSRPEAGPDEGYRLETPSERQPPESEQRKADATSRPIEKTVSLRVMFETLLDPRSIHYMLFLGGGLLVLGAIVWLVSLGVFKDPLVLAISMGIGTLAILGGGWCFTLKSRLQIAGKALTFLGCVIAPLNLWFYNAQNLITLDHNLWMAGLVCCLIYAATVYVLREPLFMYAVEFGITLTALLLLADLQWLNDASFLCAFLTALGLFSIHAERAFPPAEADEFSRRRFGLPLFWCGHVQLGSALLILLGVQIHGWMDDPLATLFGVDWYGGTLSPTVLTTGTLWLIGTYAYLYSDLIVRRHGAYTYLAAFSLLMAEVTIVGEQFQTEGVIVVLALTALVANIFQKSLQHVNESVARTMISLALGLSTLPVIMGITLHLRATNPLASLLAEQSVKQGAYVYAMLLIAACNGASAFLFRDQKRQASTIYWCFSAISLTVAAAGALWQLEIVESVHQATLLLAIPMGYLVAAHVWKESDFERPLAWIAEILTACVVMHAMWMETGPLTDLLNPLRDDFRSLLFGILFVEVAVFYVLAATLRQSRIKVLVGTVAMCAALWQFIGYWGQLDPVYYATVYAGLGMILISFGRVLGLASSKADITQAGKGDAPRGRGLLLFQSGNVILMITLLAAFLQGLSQLATQQVSSITVTSLVVTTILSFITIAIVPSGNWRRLYLSSSAILAALCLVSINLLMQLNYWQKVEIICVALGTMLIISSYVWRFLESENQHDDSVTMGLWIGSLLTTAPLLAALVYYRFDQGQIHWQEEVAIVLVTILMLVTGYVWRVKSTTLAGGGTLFVYLAITIGQLAYRPQIATGIYLAVGGGLVFLAGLILSIYRDRLLELPDRIAKREGVFQVMGWR